MKGNNFPAAVYLSELQTQFTLARKAFARVEKWARDYPKGDDDLFVHYCIVCISALAMISKLLFHGRARDQGCAEVRRDRLRNLLGIPEQGFPNIASKGVRNSLEHLDERLDDYFKGFNGTGRYRHFCHIGELAEKEGTFTPRSIDPDRLIFSSVGEQVNLQDCMAEVALLEGATNAAMKKLDGEHYPLWSE